MKPLILKYVPAAEGQRGVEWGAINEHVLSELGFWRQGRGPEELPEARRLVMATAEAISQLVGAGSLLLATTRSQAVRVLGSNCEIVIPADLRSSARLREQPDHESFYHPDVYLGRMAIPNAHRRVQQAILEALRSFRNEAYLATGTMLGSASEGAWLELFRAFNKWAGRVGEKPISVNSDTLAGRVLASESTFFGREGFKAIANKAEVGQLKFKGVVADYDYLREFRNYAVHFEIAEPFDLSYPVIATLLMKCSDYFSRLYRLKDFLDVADIRGAGS